MGKIRVKTIGEEDSKQDRDKKRKEKEAKKAAKALPAGRQAPGLKGGERVVSVGPTIDELEKEETPKEEAPEEKGKKVKAKRAAAKVKSKRYKGNADMIKSSSSYIVDKAVETLKKFAKAKFDETVELHINVKETGLSGQLNLPHGTGKQTVVKIADDAVIDQVQKGKIDFDILVATPQMMPKLAKVAKILGPRGLMPNPKAGTITDKPEDLVKKLSAGQVNFKTESKIPIIHLCVGKLSFTEKQLEENINTAIKTVGEAKINSVFLKSTMSPRIKLQV